MRVVHSQPTANNPKSSTFMHVNLIAAFPIALKTGIPGVFPSQLG